MAGCFGLQKLLVGLGIFAAAGCGHRSGSSSVAHASKPIGNQPVMMAVLPAATSDKHTYRSTPPAIQFDYPATWNCCKNHTADFSIDAPATGSRTAPSMCLDIPKLPWHVPGMIPLGMVAHGYVEDLRSNLMPDAVVKEQPSLTVCGASARRITCAGHINGKPSVDVAVIMIQADHVYILSADCEEADKDAARQTLDDAVSSLKWLK